MNRADRIAQQRADAAACSVARFWAKVDRSAGPDACWLWQAYRDQAGYGVVGRGGRTTRAHRFALELTSLRPSALHYALHHCDVRACCNPKHLYWGTYKDNAADRERRGRGGASKRRGEANGVNRHPECLLRGESSPVAKLTEAEVRAIRAAKMRPCDIVRTYGIGSSQAKRIARGESWRHVEVSS